MTPLRAKHYDTLPVEPLHAVSSQRLSFLGDSMFSRLMMLMLLFVAGLANSAGAQLVQVPESVVKAEQERIAVMQKAAPCVVSVFAGEGMGGGSGVLVDAAGFAITNYHVIESSDGFMKCGLNDGKIYDAVIVGIDPTGDVAMIQLLGRDDFPAATIADSDKVRAGDMVFAMGNPFLLASDLQPTVTYGMVSGVHRYQYPAGTFLEYTDCIQVDASINPGNSGGPLFNADGDLIGINGRISVEKRGRVNVGAGYAISMNQVMHFYDHLKSGRVVDHATLGATVTGTADGSVVVAGILENSPAYRRGLRWGDEILAFAGRPIRSVNQFKNILGIYPKGWIVPLSYRRDGQRHDIQVRLMGLHRRAELLGDNPNEDAEPRPKSPDESPLPEEKKDEKPSAVPEQYAHMFETSDEFPNRYFNHVAVKRLLSDLTRWGDYANKGQHWHLTGTMPGETAFEIRILPEAIAARLGTGFLVQPVEETRKDLPEHTGGLLTALEQLKHFLLDRDEYFTELYYLGSEPISPDLQKVDVLITTKGLISSRWFFDKKTGHLIGFDTSLEEDADPCEIRFGELQSFNGVSFPSKFTVRAGSHELGEINVTGLQFVDGAGVQK